MTVWRRSRLTPGGKYPTRSITGSALSSGALRRHPRPATQPTAKSSGCSNPLSAQRSACGMSYAFGGDGWSSFGRPASLMFSAQSVGEPRERVIDAAGNLRADRDRNDGSGFLKSRFQCRFGAVCQFTFWR